MSTLFFRVFSFFTAFLLDLFCAFCSNLNAFRKRLFKRSIESRRLYETSYISSQKVWGKLTRMQIWSLRSRRRWNKPGKSWRRKTEKPSKHAVGWRSTSKTVFGSTRTGIYCTPIAISTESTKKHTSNVLGYKTVKNGGRKTRWPKRCCELNRSIFLSVKHTPCIPDLSVYVEHSMMWNGRCPCLGHKLPLGCSPQPKFPFIVTDLISRQRMEGL